MATTFFEGIEIGSRSVHAALERSVAYVIDSGKTDFGRLVYSFGCEAQSAAQEMYLFQQQAEQATGRGVKRSGEKKSYCAMWMRQSFAPGEVTPEQALEIGRKLAEEVLGDNYQYVVATHIDSHCVHNHIIFNAIGSDYKKFHQDKYTPDRVARISDRLCREHGLSVIEEPQKERPGLRHPGKNFSGYRDVMRKDIDRVSSRAKSWEEFLSLMEKDYYIFQRGSRLSFRHRTNGQQRNFTLAGLGAGYSEAALRKKIEGCPRGQPRAPYRANPDSYSSHLRHVKSMLAAMETMDRRQVFSQSEYLARLSGLRERERETLEGLKSARAAGEFHEKEGLLQARLEEIRAERKELFRLRAEVGKMQKEKEDDFLDR